MIDHLTLISLNRLKELLALEHSFKEIATVSQFTVCCDYLIDNDNPVVKWNSFNQVVQCHNCGTTYVATNTKRAKQEPDGTPKSVKGSR